MSSEGGFVFYPRKYKINGENHAENYVEGVNREGKKCIVFIRPNDQALYNAKNTNTAQSIPTLESFSQNHRRARTPCPASEDNGPSNPCGVLLVEQSIRDEKLSIKHNADVYIGGWASILSEGDYMPSPLIGKGFLELNFHFKETDEAKYYREQWYSIKQRVSSGRISEEEKANANDDMENLYSQYISLQTNWFVGVLIGHKKTIELGVNPDKKDILEQVESSLDREAPPGMYRGVMLRVRDSEVVKSRISTSINAQYDYINRRPKTAKEVVAEFTKYNNQRLNQISEGNFEVDIIPTLRVNCGRKGNDKYSREIKPYGKIQNCYIDRRFHNSPGNYAKQFNGFLYSDIAIRLAEINNGGTKGNLILSSIHSFSKPIGNAMTIGNNGEAKFKIDLKNESSNNNEPENMNSNL